MNKERRAIISKLVTSLEDIRSEIEQVMTDEQDAYDNLPEGLQSSDKGEAMQSAIDALQSACDDAEGVVTQLEEAAG